MNAPRIVPEDERVEFGEDARVLVLLRAYVGGARGVALLERAVPVAEAYFEPGDWWGLWGGPDVSEIDATIPSGAQVTIDGPPRRAWSPRELRAQVARALGADAPLVFVAVTDWQATTVGDVATEVFDDTVEATESAARVVAGVAREAQAPVMWAAAAVLAVVALVAFIYLRGVLP